MTVVGAGTPSPTELWRAAREARGELREQLRSLHGERSDIVDRLGNGEVTGLAERKGLETRLEVLDKRIAAMDEQVALADAKVAAAASVPGAVPVDPPYVRQGPPEEAFVLGGIFMVVCLLPLSVAMARRVWKRGSAIAAALPAELMERMQRLDQSVESIAIEVERIGESQRFMTRVFTEQGGARALGAAPAEPVRQSQHEPLPLGTRDLR